MSDLPRLEDLDALDRDALMDAWGHIVGMETPARTSMPFMRRVVAFEIQAKIMGGLSRSTRRLLEAPPPGTTQGTRQIEAGGRLIREWNGDRHVVEARNDGFYWRDTRYKSLSAVARAITGAHWSGPRFFGLQGRSS
jgi:hypothetical protein